MPSHAAAVKTRHELLSLSGERAFAFIHLAGMVPVDQCEKNPQQAQALNVEGTLKWYRACVEAGGNHFVYVSTAHVYAPSERLLKTGDPVEPRSAYARTKFEAE